MGFDHAVITEYCIFTDFVRKSTVSLCLVSAAQMLVHNIPKVQ